MSGGGGVEPAGASRRRSSQTDRCSHVAFIHKLWAVHERARAVRRARALKLGEGEVREMSIIRNGEAVHDHSRHLWCPARVLCVRGIRHL